MSDDNTFEVRLSNTWPNPGNAIVTFSMKTIVITGPSIDAKKAIIVLLERAKRDLEALLNQVPKPILTVVPNADN